MLASCKLLPIKKDVSKYLSKYISKGGELVNKIIESGRQEELPRQWWTASTPMRKALRDSMRSVSPKSAWSIFKDPELYVMGGVISWYSYVTVKIGDEERVVGLVAYLMDDSVRRCLEEPSG